jgi:Glycine zipper
MRNILSSALLLCASLALTGCETAGPSEQRGTLLGAAGGAGLGAIIGNNVSGMNSAQGALAGAAIGGLVGNRAGRQQDENAALRAQQHTIVVDVRNGDGTVTPVMIRQIGPSRFQGPQGEIYTSFPTQAQLARRYAR